MRQRSRPYLFSNSIPPVVAGASLAVLGLLGKSTELRDRVMANALQFRKGMAAAGFEIKEGIHPIVPVMLGDAALAAKFADAMLAKGVYVIAFSYPVVPQGKARIRTQISAAHTERDLAFAINAFAELKQELKV